MIWSSVLSISSSFMPAEVTKIASDVTDLYTFVVVVSAIACALIIGGMIYFVIKYRRKSANDKTAYITHNTYLEVLWSFIPLVIFLFLFGWGWKIFHEMRNVPQNVMEVHVTGKQWLWEFTYKSGRKVTNELYVPVNAPVRLIMTSEDVIHSFFIPSFRIKQDVVPGRYTALWFEAEKEGEFQIFCTEFCGTAHSTMLAKVHVLSNEEYMNWLESDPTAGKSLAEIGKGLLTTKGCIACHSEDGSAKVGPSFKGLFGSDRQFDGADSVKGDENYIRESILNPKAKVVKGFPAGVMPTFQGQIKDDEVNAIIEYFKTLK
jgi:cytochrome c oxidase subunit II